MTKLYETFQGYFKLNISRIKWILMFAFLLMVLFYILQKKGYMKEYNKQSKIIYLRVLLALNCSFIYVMTLFGRKIGKTREMRMIPFESYLSSLMRGNTEVLLQIIVNVVMYIPIGFLLPCCFRYFKKHRHVIIVAFLSSLFIEIVQLIFRMGLFEVDDIISNVLGAFIGLGLCVLFLRVKSIIKESFNKHRYKS